MFSFFFGTGAHPINYHYKSSFQIIQLNPKNSENPNFRAFPQIFSSQYRYWFWSKATLKDDIAQYPPVILFLQMGSQLCKRDNQQPNFSTNPFEYVYDEDNKELKITHDDHIECNYPEAEKYLQDCEDKLKKSHKIFKDKTMRTETIILKSLTDQDTQVKCTFERPYVFLNDSTATRGKSYKILNRLDSKSSQIIVRDEALQYFGVFLCYLADNPRLIIEILTTGPSTYGVHCLKMNINSNIQPIYIDDYVLCLDRAPLFSQPIKGQYMWTCLLEKAWLKVNGNISTTIDKVDPKEPFNTFLSYPTRSYLLKEQTIKPSDDQYIDSENIKLLQTNIYNLPSNKGCIITTKKNPRHKIGISGRKNYYLIRCFQFKGKQLYYLRNPCSKGLDFRGKQSELNEELIEQLRRITKDERIPEGNFVMEEDEMLEQVESFFIVHYQPNSSVISQLSLSLQEEKEFFVQFQLTHDGYVSLSLHQQSTVTKEKIFSPLSHLVVSESNSLVISDLQNMQGSFGVSDTYLLQNLYEDLKTGRYLVRLKKKRNGEIAIGKTNDKFVITAPFKVTSFNKDQPSLKTLFENYLKQVGRSKISDIFPERQSLKQNFNHVGYWVGDLAVIYIQNTHKSKREIKIEVSFSQQKNLKCTSDVLQESFIVVENIQDERLIIFEKIDLTEETRLGRYVIQSF